jgi:AcrR family transcriptional regulator
MSTDRRPYRREPEEARREALIEAALELVAVGGPQAATVRAIAARAGVTPGLIRHYFATKEELTRAAYRRFVQMLTDDSAAALSDAGPDPTARLAAFVAASLRPPVVDAHRLGLWAGFDGRCFGRSFADRGPLACRYTLIACPGLGATARRFDVWHRCLFPDGVVGSRGASGPTFRPAVVDGAAVLGVSGWLDFL